MKLFTGCLPTSWGTMTAAVDTDGALVRLLFPTEGAAWDAEIQKRGYTIQPDAERCQTVLSQLAEYFTGGRRDFDVPLKPVGTSFQLTVWHALEAIPYGQTISYRELAERIGNPAAVRAVGRANGSNPIPIIIPCHRVIGADGSLTGYGGGLPLKEALLRLEGLIVPKQMQFTLIN